MPDELDAACADCIHHDKIEHWCNMWDVEIDNPDDSHCNQYNYPLC